VGNFQGINHVVFIDQILAEVRYYILRPINLIHSKEELPQQLKESIVVPICNMGDETDCSSYEGMSLGQLHTKFYLAFSS
jgi:hypothetical protein